MLDRQAAIELILDRYERPLYRGVLPVPPARAASATNSRCGDQVTIYAHVADGRVLDVRFGGGGCTISQAAADVTAELATGRALAEVRALGLRELLAVLGAEGVGSRLDCATLALRTLRRTLAGMESQVRGQE